MKSQSKRLTTLIGLFVILALINPTFAAKRSSKKSIKRRYPSPPPISIVQGTQNLAATIRNSISNVDPHLNIGVGVKSMKTGEILYTYNNHRPFVPASILKIMTAEAALLYLGADYKFQTNFYTDATDLRNGVLYGNLYLVHSGDPTLTYYDLIDLLGSLKGQQINRVEGNVYIDTTAYDQVNYGPGWIWNDKRYCYAAPINASIINHNCLSFKVAPGKNVGHPADVLPNPRIFYSAIQNSVITKAPSARACYIRLGTQPNSSITISGCLPKGHYAQGVTTVVGDIMAYNIALLRTLFHSYQIQIGGIVYQGSAPANLAVIATHQSKPLYELISTMLKKSDNIIAGSIFKKLGETYTRRPGTWESGSLAVHHILAKKAGVNIANMSVLDGSGLSRYNQITPSQMLQVLDFAYHHHGTNYEFISGLPVAGIDGTLKNRLQNISWKVRAKTGTMNGVNALAGYAVSRDKEPLAFVIIINGRYGMGWRYKELEDRIVTSLTKFSRG